MTQTTIRRPGELAMTERRSAMALLSAETDVWNRMLSTIDGDEWDTPTVCERWSVRDIVGHLCGHAEEVNRPWMFPVRDRRGRKHHPDLPGLDGHMEVQVDEHRDLTTEELRAHYAKVWAKAVRMLGRVPGIIRRQGIKTGMPEMPRIGFDYLHDIVYTRDNWMHRDDVCRAIGREFEAHPHDAEVVAQVMRDLDLDFWKQPAVIVELTGIAPGTWQVGAGTPETTVRADALEFMRVLAGRSDDPAAAVTLVVGSPEIAQRVADTRVPF
jgi:uncharacterized protein (TIGR03083 family)